MLVNRLDSVTIWYEACTSCLFQSIWKSIIQVQIGSFPQGSGWKFQTYLKPPPSLWNSTQTADSQMFHPAETLSSLTKHQLRFSCAIPETHIWQTPSHSFSTLTLPNTKREEVSLNPKNIPKITKPQFRVFGRLGLGWGIFEKNNIRPGFLEGIFLTDDFVCERILVSKKSTPRCWGHITRFA